MTSTRPALIFAALLCTLLGGCRDETGTPSAGIAPTRAPELPRCEPAPRYVPPPGEEPRAVKRLAGRVAQRATSYEWGATRRSVARTLTSSAADRTPLADAVGPLVRRGTQSCGRVVYAQLAGLTETSAGVMVAVCQTIVSESGRRSQTRVLDVRLARAPGGAWELDMLGSVGGSPAPRARPLTAAARSVLRHPRITLTDSARWDIQRGTVDDLLLLALAREADTSALSVLVIQSGHPVNVWATTRRSAHADGRAADIYAVDDELVSAQREVGSPAYELTGRLIAAGAAQVGSPWDFAVGVGSFTDPVHQDHIHLQQSGLG